MNISKPLVIAGLSIAALILFNQNTREYSENDDRKADFIEFSSVLWKAHVYSSEIKFMSDDSVIHTIHFDYSDRHVSSVSYRNLHGYFDPVFVTVWRRGQTYKALIIDPIRELLLLEVDTESEIDVSVSSNNKILITYEKLGRENGMRTEDHVVSWPL